jgi:hypothetical protein
VITTTPPLARVFWVDVLNVSGMEIPAFACVLPVDADTDGVIHVDQHTDDSSLLYLFNGPFRIAAGNYGLCTLSCPSHVLANGSPANGDVVGTVTGEWYVETGQTGLLCVGAPVAGRIVVVPEICVT